MTSAQPKRKLTEGQRRLYELLRASDGKHLSGAEILSAAGLKPSSWKSYFGKGHYQGILTRRKGGDYRVTLPPDFSELEFLRRTTQSAELREIGGLLDQPLARSLLRRSRDNLLLALELYNRPSLQNRIDGFVMLFSTAWEQLLKAGLVEAHGERSIFKEVGFGRRRETISLQTCLERSFPEASDHVRRNIERIAEIRHEATHLVVPELQGIVARLFQAGVINYARRYRRLAGEALLPSVNVGLMCFVTEDRPLDVSALASLYGPGLADEMVEYANTLADEMDASQHADFAVRLDVRLRFAKSGEEADVTLVQATDAPTSAVVVVKPVDPEKTHPYRTTQIIERVRTLLGSRNVECSFTTHTLQAILRKEGWKKADNQYHRLQLNPNTPKYSEACAEEIVRLICADPTYVQRVLAGARKPKSAA